MRFCWAGNKSYNGRQGLLYAPEPVQLPLSFTAPSWDRIYDMLIELAKRVKDSGFKPDLIVGVCRGGWAPARVMSDLLENANTASIRIEFYLAPGVTAKKPVISQAIMVPVKGVNVLVVDDVADTGESLKVAVEHLEVCGAKAIRTATLYYKPQSILKPDFFIIQTEQWIIFPWERLESARRLLDEAEKTGKSVDSVRETLTGAGIESNIVERLIEFARHYR
ncbi:phosphoribosyltransferase [[Eubacterium] cellulosolvens]